LCANDLIYINWALAKDTLLKLGQGLSLGMLTLLPAIADLDVGTLYRRPGNATCGLFLAILASMCRKGVIEGFPVNILRVRRQV
jgi:hypothetical protein